MDIEVQCPSCGTAARPERRRVPGDPKNPMRDMAFGWFCPVIACRVRLADVLVEKAAQPEGLGEDDAVSGAKAETEEQVALAEGDGLAPVSSHLVEVKNKPAMGPVPHRALPPAPVAAPQKPRAKETSDDLIAQVRARAVASRARVLELEAELVKARAEADLFERMAELIPSPATSEPIAAE